MLEDGHDACTVEMVLDEDLLEQVARLDALQDSLCAQHGARWREVLEEDNMIRAVNQVVVQGDCALADGDEVAFFPPVTGG